MIKGFEIHSILVDKHVAEWGQCHLGRGVFSVKSAVRLSFRDWELGIVDPIVSMEDSSDQA